MKNAFLFLSLLALCSCGTIGIGKNRDITIHNASKDVVIVKSTQGTTKVQPGSDVKLYTNKDVEIESTNKKCDSANIAKETNTAALVLDIIPGIIFNIIPLIIDGTTGDLYRMPDTYMYDCI